MGSEDRSFSSSCLVRNGKVSHKRQHRDVTQVDLDMLLSRIHGQGHVAVLSRPNRKCKGQGLYNCRNDIDYLGYPYAWDVSKYS
jgi:hypothetical protein